MYKRIRRSVYRILFSRKLWIVSYPDAMEDCYGNSLGFRQSETYLYKRNAKIRYKRLLSYNENAQMYSIWCLKSLIKNGEIWVEDWCKKA